MKKSMLKTLMACFLCLMVAVSAVACGSTTNTTNTTGTSANTAAATQAAESTAPVKQPVTLSLSGSNGMGTDGLKAALKLYEQDTGNKIDLQLYPDDQYQNIVKTKMATNDTPDVVEFWATASNFAENQVEVLDGPWVKQLPEDKIKLKYGRASDGKIVVAPFGTCMLFGVAYNKDVFKKAGITPPLKTYNDFLAACESIKKIGVTPVELGNKDNWTAQIFGLVGLNYLFKDNATMAQDMLTNKIKPADSTAWLDFTKRMLALKDKEYINKDYMSVVMNDARKPVIEGKAAMLFELDADYGEFKKVGGDNFADKVGFMPMTFGDDYVDVVKGAASQGFWIPTAAKKKDAAREFINTMLTEKYLTPIYQQSPGSSPLNGLNLPGSAWTKEMDEYAKSIPSLDPWCDAYLSVMDLGGLRATMFQDMFAGKEPKKALADWYAEYSKLCKAKKIQGY